MYVFYSLSLRWYVGVVVSYIEYVNWPFFLVMTFFFRVMPFLIVLSFYLFWVVQSLGIAYLPPPTVWRQGRKGGSENTIKLTYSNEICY